MSGILDPMRHVLLIALGVMGTPAASQDLKVLLCTAQDRLNLSSDSLTPVPSDKTYTWELYYENEELVSVAAPFNCIEDSEEWSIGATVISLECRQGVADVSLVRIFAEIDRYAQSFMVSGITDNDADPQGSNALWIEEGRCELARRKF